MPTALAYSHKHPEPAQWLSYGSPIDGLRDTLIDHRVYHALETLDHVRVFMAYHVFAVWDFMSLVKRLQQSMTNVSLPWVPQGDPGVRMMINEIVLGEESDSAAGGLSHFEWYLEAMTEAGADTTAIDTFVGAVRSGEDYRIALRRAKAPAAVVEFVKDTMTIATEGDLHEVSAAFAVGRENLIPGMFKPLIQTLSRRHIGKLDSFLAYVERHIEVDEGEHGELAMHMVESACGTEGKRRAAAKTAAVDALTARCRLWDAILEEIG